MRPDAHKAKATRQWKRKNAEPTRRAEAPEVAPQQRISDPDDSESDDERQLHMLANAPTPANESNRFRFADEKAAVAGTALKVDATFRRLFELNIPRIEQILLLADHVQIPDVSRQDEYWELAAIPIHVPTSLEIAQQDEVELQQDSSLEEPAVLQEEVLVEPAKADSEDIDDWLDDVLG